jgi:hypothetical protein
MGCPLLVVTIELQGGVESLSVKDEAAALGREKDVSK